jgi:glutathione S-transferase
MITLFGFGPAFGLPDPSPFVTKVEVLLKMEGLPYRTESSMAAFRKAPKGKLPYVDDDGTLIADSTFIRWHLEKKHGVDFDAGYDARQRATAWAVEKMLEDHLYWAAVFERWAIEANFNRGPRAFFDKAPAPLRPLLVAIARRKVRANLHGQGFGRHAPEDIAALGIRSVEAVADILGERPYLLGETTCGADATAFAFVAGVLCPVFDSSLRRAAEGRQNLVAYRDRMMARLFWRDRWTAGKALVCAYPTISFPAKNCRISISAFSGLSEPCTEFSPTERANSLRIVPSAAWAGFVAPMISRYRRTAFSPSSTWTTTGPEVMNATSSPKNGRSRWTA